jgi:hypothetical protein
MILTRRLAALLALPVLLAGALPGSAEEEQDPGLLLHEGMWQFDISVLLPLQTDYRHQTLQRCIDSEPITPSDLMPWAEERSCKLKGIKVKADKLSWKITCNQSGQPPSRGRGEFKASGDSGVGKSRIDFEVAGQRQSIKTKWDAKRLRDCLPEEAERLQTRSGPDTSKYLNQ